MVDRMTRTEMLAEFERWTFAMPGYRIELDEQLQFDGCVLRVFVTRRSHSGGPGGCRSALSTPRTGPTRGPFELLWPRRRGRETMPAHGTTCAPTTSQPAEGVNPR